ncbi:unnamed protein product [Caenorhabditis angaria]|uniref:Uncharacterized protein n=1 Tax=Caenorhabditis angaria TaxID=860376 RepID=A0A9P1I9Q4_9PELO|nr:unnamed protein product [Caenorhabditis angaria]
MLLYLLIISIILTLFALILNHFIAKHWGPSKQLALFLKFATGLTIIALLCAIILFSIIKSQKDAMEIEKLSETMQKTENYLKDSHEKLNGISTANLKIAQKINVSMVSAEILDIIENRTDFREHKSVSEKVDVLLSKINENFELVLTGNMVEDCKDKARALGIKEKVRKLQEEVSFEKEEVEKWSVVDFSEAFIEKPVRNMKKSLEYFQVDKIDVAKMETERDQADFEKSSKTIAEISIYAQNFFVILILCFALFQCEICLTIRISKYFLAVSMIIFAILWVVLTMKMKMNCEVKFDFVEMIQKYHSQSEQGQEKICKFSENRIFDGVNYTKKVDDEIIAQKFEIFAIQEELWRVIAPKIEIKNINFTDLIDVVGKLKDAPIRNCFLADSSELKIWEDILVELEDIERSVEKEMGLKIVELENEVMQFINKTYSNLVRDVSKEINRLLTIIDSSNLPCSKIHKIFSTANSSICQKYYTIEDITPVLILTILTNLAALLILIVSSSGKMNDDFSERSLRTAELIK